VHPSSRPHAQWAKRLFDVLVGGTALLLLSPILLTAAVLVKITSPGPILFRQPRVGRNRRTFGMLKFRTMVQNAEELRAQIEQLNDAKGIMFKIRRDPRLTSVGPLLRRTSIDELPQLLNVLRGEMSLVGPRPIPVWVYDQIHESSFHRRFSVLPGMTGLWQVHGRQQHYTAMARHDLAYVDRWSLWLDLEILARTIPAVLRRGEAI
jgi:lipopolysaccharide/colanic/teichoic acid biosynthesis glycosyltransferase